VLEEGRYVWVSKNWCHCPCAPWNVDLEAVDPSVGWTNMACFYLRIPVCQTVSYAAVKSSKTAPVFRFCWNPFSMKVVRAATWSQVLRPSTFPETSLWISMTLNINPWHHVILYGTSYFKNCNFKMVQINNKSR